jgi:hypothetical protein
MSEADPSRPYEGVQEYNQRTRYGRMDNANYIPTNHPGVASAQQVINNAKNQVAPRFRPQQIVREPSRGDLHILPVLPNMQRHRGPKDISIMPVGMVQPLDGNQQLHTMPYFQQQPQTVQTQGLVSATSLPNPTNNFRYLPRDGFAPQIVPRVSNAPSPIPLRNTLY